MIAFCLIRQGPAYRADAFHSGLRAVGFEVRTTAPATFARDDALVIWNRYSDNHAHALRAEAAGAQVFIAENAFVGPGGISAHDMMPRSWYTISRTRHNDDMLIPAGDGSRWDALGVTLKPWRTDGAHILVAANRAFGTPGFAMDVDWPQRIVKDLQRRTKREVRLRPHPGNDASKVKPLARDLEGAHSCVVWTSSAGCQALIAGIPVICCAPAWICKGAAFGNFPSEWDAMETAEPAYLDFNRLRAMHRLAWAQWHLDEIASGEPFRRLLDRG